MCIRDRHITSGAQKDTIIMMEPTDLVYSKGQQETFTSPELRDYISKQINRGSGNVVQYEVEYHKRIASSFASFILTIIGVSLGGELCMRAAAMEPRIRRVVSWSVLPSIYGALMADKPAEIRAKLEHWLDEHLPDIIKALAVPFICTIVMVPLTILVIGPVSNVLANAIAAAYNFLANNVPALAAILVGGIWQVFVIFGVHWGVTPMCLANFANYGCDSFQAFQTCAVIAQAAACFGVFLKTKKADIKNVSLSAGLTGIFGMPDMSGVGISFGADRIYDVMTGLGLFPEEVNFSTRVFFTNLGQEEQAAALGLLRELRDAGVAAEIYPDCGKMKKQMEYANRRGIPYVVIVGSQELEAKAATVKDMRSGEQRQVPFGELAEYLK